MKSDGFGTPFSPPRKTDEQLLQQSVLAGGTIPDHIAVIMDGNGRWAQKRGLPRIAGHKAGAEALRRIVKSAREIGIKILTVYAFSTENWKRPEAEVNLLMNLLEEYLVAERKELLQQGVKLNTLGDIDQLPRSCQAELQKTVDFTGHNQDMLLNIAVNYGARQEIVAAVREICLKVLDGRLDRCSIDEATISSHLHTRGIPDPDLLIRPSGEMRLSNFLLWQMAYTEFWFAERLWPDFDETDLYAAIKHFQTRDRRFGGLK